MVSMDHMMEYFIHPVKSRVLMGIMKKERASAKELAAEFPDIPQATLYRYLKRMLEDEMIVLVEEKKIRGMVEKVYAISPELFSKNQSIPEENTGEWYLKMFTSFMAGLYREFSDYAKRPDINLMEQPSGFSVCPVTASPEELRQISLEFQKILAPYMEYQPGAGRSMHSIGIVITPPRDAGTN